MSFNDELNKNNSEKIVLLEIDIPVTERKINHAPGVWVVIVAPGSQDVIDDFGNVGYYGNRNATYKNIQSLNVAGTLYSEYASLAALESAGEGWFYDTATTKVYFILDSYNPPEYFISVTPGAALGFTSLSATTNYYEDIYYEPRLIDAPNISKSKDPLYYGILQYNTPSFLFDNADGFFDSYSTLKLYNQPYRVFLTFAGEAYSDALQVYEGKILEFEHDFISFRMTGKDARASLSRKLPINTFSNSDSTLPFYFAGLDDSLDGTAVPIAFGSVINAPAYWTSSGNWTFADTTYNAILATIVVTKEDGTTFSHGGTETDGTFTGANTTDDLFVTFTQSAVVNGLDVIADCAENYEGITYSSTTYDTVEWVYEKTIVRNTGIWIGEGNLMTTADIAEQICVENNGIFEQLADGKYTFRTYDKSRFPTYEITEDETLDDGAIRHPANQILSDIRIDYSEDLLAGKFRTVHNTDYQDYVFGNINGYKETPEPVLTRLTSKTDATALSVDLMEQSKDIPNIVSIATKTQNIEMRILDNILYHYKRQNGNEILARSKYQVLGISLNLSEFTMDFTIKQIEEDDDIYIILEGGDSSTAYDYYGGASSSVRPANIITGRGAA